MQAKPIEEDANVTTDEQQAKQREMWLTRRATLTERMRRDPLSRTAYEALVERGNIQAELGQYADAAEDYTRALAIIPLGISAREMATLHDNRGVVRMYLGDYYAALADFTAAVERDPTYVYSWANRAYVYNVVGKFVWAVDDAGRALRLKPTLSTALETRGNAYREMGDYAQALADLDASLRVNPGCVQAPYHRALLHHAQGRIADALADVELYLSRPDDQEHAVARREKAERLRTELHMQM